MKVYKLTDQKRITRGGFYWPRKGFHPPRLSGEGALCGPGWYHGYEHPLLAVLHNPAHASFKNPRLFEIEVEEADVGRLDGQLKLGFRTGVVLGELVCPKVTTEQRVRYAIGCVLVVLDPANLPKWRAWAQDWLENKDRSWKAAEVAATAETAQPAVGAVRVPARVVAEAAAVAARVAAAAAQEAAWTTREVVPLVAWEAAGEAALLAAKAVQATVRATHTRVVVTHRRLDLVKIAMWAVSDRVLLD